MNLKRDEKLVIEWQDGHTCVYSIAHLRTMCPCAQCKGVRAGNDPAVGGGAATGGGKKKSLLTILPGNFAAPLRAEGAEFVGNYALRIDWSDGHGSGIYSFEYLRDICPPPPQQPG